MHKDIVILLCVVITALFSHVFKPLFATALMFQAEIGSTVAHICNRKKLNLVPRKINSVPKKIKFDAGKIIFSAKKNPVQC